MFDKQGHATTKGGDSHGELWDYVLTNSEKWQAHDLKLMYLTHRFMQEDVSLIAYTSGLDRVSEFIAKNMSTLDYIAGVYCIPLAKTCFFRAPANTREGLKRFTINIGAEPKRIADIYHEISQLKPSRSVVPVYLAYTFRSPHECILLSTLVLGGQTLEKFITDYIKPISGVRNIEYTYISKTKRLISFEEWKEFSEQHLIVPKGKQIEIEDEFDDDMIAGC